MVNLPVAVGVDASFTTEQAFRGLVSIQLLLQVVGVDASFTTVEVGVDASFTTLIPTDSRVSGGISMSSFLARNK